MEGSNANHYTSHALTKKDPRSRSRTSDLEISIASSYSLPLYQLSYTRTYETAVLAEWLRRMLKAHVRKSVGSIPTDCKFLFSFVESRSWSSGYDRRLPSDGPGFNSRRAHFFFGAQKKKTKKSGGAGYRSLCLTHAKRALYHLSYTPNPCSVSRQAFLAEWLRRWI